MKQKQILLGITLLLTTLGLSSTFAQTKDVFSDKFIKKAMNKAAYWQLKNPKHKLYDWTNGAFYAGLFEAYETTGSKKIYKAMMGMGEANQWNPGPRLHHADDHAICQIYVDLYRKEQDKGMLQPFIDTLESFIKTPYPTKGIQKITWWWCDALFMAPPALVKLGVTLNEPKYFALNDKLFDETYDMLYDKEEHLFARDLNYVWGAMEKDKKEANGQKVFWSRGNGWVMGGLVRILEELPQDYKKRPMYEQLFKEMAAKIINIQPEDGLWRASLLDPDSYPGGEASGSGFYCYALAWGINQGLLEKETFMPAVEKAWKGLVGVQQSSGKIGWVQPIGHDPRKNFSADSWEVYGTGAFLLAGSEVIKLK